MGIIRIQLDSDDVKLANYDDKIVFRKHSIRLQNVIDNAKSLGYEIPDFWELRKLDSHLIIPLNDVLDKLDVFYFFGGTILSDNSFKTLNLVSQNYDSKQYGGSFGWTEYGVTGDGSSYISTEFNPSIGSNNFVTNGACIGGVLTKDSTSNIAQQRNFTSNSDASGHNTIRINNGSTEGYSNINSDSSTITTFDFSGTGLKSTVRINDLRVVSYNKSTNSEQRETVIGLSNSIQNLMKFTDVGNTYYTDFEYGAFFMGGKLTSTEMEQIRTAINNFYLSIGLLAIA